MIATREEVIESLKRTVENVPSNLHVAVPVPFFEDVLELLQPTARLLTPEEVRELPDGTVLWAECKLDRKALGLEESDEAMTVEYECNVAQKINGEIRGTGYIAGILETMLDDLSTMMRCWTSEPTDEQRKEAKWG